MKTIPILLTTLLVIVGHGRAAVTNTPPNTPPNTPAPGAPAAPKPTLTPETEAAVRSVLERANAETNKPTPRATPTRLNTNNGVTATPAPGSPTTAAPASPPVAPAPGLPAAVPPGSAVVPGRPGTNPATMFPGLARATNNPGATNRLNLQANPVLPGAPGAAPSGPRNVAGLPGAPGAAGAGTPAAAGAAGAAGPGAAGDPNEVFPPGLIKFNEADLSQVLEIYQELTGRTVLKPASVPAAKISIRTQTELTRAEAIQALDTILGMNGITMVPQGEKFIKAVAEGQAGSTGAKFNDGEVDQLPEAARYVTQLVQLTNASPNDLMPILTPFSKVPNGILTIPSAGMLVLRDYAENVKRMVEMIKRVDIVPQQEFESVVIPIKYALAGDIAQVLGSLTAGGGGGTTTVGRNQSRTGLSGPTGGFGGAGGAGGGLPGQPGYNPNNPNAFNQQQGQFGGAGGAGGTGRSSFQNRLQQIVRNASSPGGGGGSGDIFVLEQAKVIADERINALLIFASKKDLTTISNIIDKLDVVLAQVLIEAIVMEVSLGNDLNYGISYLQTQPTQIKELGMTGIGAIKNGSFLGAGPFGSMATNASGVLPSGFSYFASFANFDATAYAVANDSRVNVISRPRIQTSHAVEANLFVGNTRPYVTGSYSYFGGGPQTQFQQQQIGLTLSVLPLINAEGLVVMDIRTKIQQIGEEIAIDENFKVPETIDREANAKVAVRDRETVMLGGFIAASKNKTVSGVPLLMDIPILGHLFRSNSTRDQRRELIILIRPTVLPTPQDAATHAAETRAKMPGTRAADYEFQESERKLLERENRRLEKNNRKLYKEENFTK